MKLCSAYNDEIKLVCDRPAGHKGAHMAQVVWADGSEGTDEADDVDDV